MASHCHGNSTGLVLPPATGSASPEIIGLFLLNFLALFCVVIRLSRAERLISDLIDHKILTGYGLDTVRQELDTLKRHRQRITIQENVYQKVLIQVENRTKELTSLLEAKERNLERVTERVTKLAATYASTLPEFTQAVSSLRHDVAELHVKLESEVSSLHFRLSAFSSPASSLCLDTCSEAKPDTLYVHRTLLPEKNVNDEFVHVPGLGLISTEELDQLDGMNTAPFDAGVKTLKKKKSLRFGLPRWMRRKTNKDLRSSADLIEEDRASFGFRSRM